MIQNFCFFTWLYVGVRNALLRYCGLGGGCSAWGYVFRLVTKTFHAAARWQQPRSYIRVYVVHRGPPISRLFGLPVLCVLFFRLCFSCVCFFPSFFSLLFKVVFGVFLLFLGCCRIHDRIALATLSLQRYDVPGWYKYISIVVWWPQEEPVSRLKNQRRHGLGAGVLNVDSSRVYMIKRTACRNILGFWSVICSTAALW